MLNAGWETLSMSELWLDLMIRVVIGLILFSIVIGGIQFTAWKARVKRGKKISKIIDSVVESIGKEDD